MEQLQHDFGSTVDTSRPFTSVKEAVAIFGQRLILGDIYSPNPSPPTPTPSPTPIIKREPSWRLSSPSPMKSDQDNNSTGLVDVIKKLEAELGETKVELKLLKERGSETEVALATLNAELHKNMSKLAQAEAAAAGKAAAAATTTPKTVRFEITQDNKEYIMSKNTNESQKLAHILNLGENDHHLFGGKKGASASASASARKHKHKHKQKPIIPLVADFFFKSKNSCSTNHHNPLYASPF